MVQSFDEKKGKDVSSTHVTLKGGRWEGEGNYTYVMLVDRQHVAASWTEDQHLQPTGNQPFRPISLSFRPQVFPGFLHSKSCNSKNHHNQSKSCPSVHPLCVRCWSLQDTFQPVSAYVAAGIKDPFRYATRRPAFPAVTLLRLPNLSCNYFLFLFILLQKVNNNTRGIRVQLSEHVDLAAVLDAQHRFSRHLAITPTQTLASTRSTWAAKV